MAKAFQSATDASTVLLNLSLGLNWKVTLGGNRTIQINNAEKGDVLTVMLTQDGTGNRTVTWPSNVRWQAGQAPNLNTTAGAADVVELKYDGTYWRDVAGAPSKLPSRIVSAALTAMTVLTGANAAMTYHLSRGAGTGEMGRLPAVSRIYAGTGAGLGSGTLLQEIDGSGSVKVGKWGGIAVGMNDPSADRLDKTSNSGAWLPNGNLTTRGTIKGKSLLSGATLGASNFGSAVLTHGAVPCIKAGGSLGYMLRTASGGLAATCN